MTETTAVTADVTAGMTDGYVRVCSVNDLPTVGAVQVEIDDKQVAIVRDSAGNIHAIDDTCSHANVSLSEGDVEDGAIECWLHGSRFDLRTGEPTSPPAITPIAVYPVNINGGDVFVSVTKEN
jgi:3-phenylpropionate/trans-cinnamate dioxygenase ferredoxin subunit